VRLSSVAAAALGAATFALAAPALAAPVQVQQCFITVPKALSSKASGTQIVYVNRGRQAAESVTFAVGYRNASGHFLRTVSDVGDFAPNTPINHHFGLYSDVTYAGKHTTSCRAVAVRWADGTHWRV
jgi:hypothetical protein